MFGLTSALRGAALIAQLVKNPLANAGDPGSIPGSQSQEDPLEKGEVTRSSIPGLPL